MNAIAGPASRVRSVAERLLLISLPVYVITLPLLTLTLVADPLTGKGVVAADIAFVGVLAGFVLAGQPRWLPLQRDLAAVASGLLVVLAVSAAMTGTPRAFVEVARVAYSLIVMLVLAHLRLRDDERGRVVNAWLLTALLLAAIAVVGYVAVSAFGVPAVVGIRWGSPILGSDVLRTSAFMHPNAFALYLGLSLALLVYRFAACAISRVWVHVCVGLLVMAGALTISRGFAGLVVTLALLAMHDGAPPWLRQSRRTLAVAAGVMIMVVAVSLVWAITPLERAADSLVSVAPNTRPSPYGVLHLAAARMVLARPILGVGLDAFGSQVCHYTSAEVRAMSHPPISCDMDWDPHSTWGAYAAETGVVGLAAWVALYAVVLARLLRSRAAPGTLSMPGVASAAMVGVLFLGGVHVDFTHVKLVWAFLGLALATCDESGVHPGPISGQLRW